MNPFKALKVLIFIFDRQQNATGSASTVKSELPLTLVIPTLATSVKLASPFIDLISHCKEAMGSLYLKRRRINTHFKVLG